MPDYSVEELTNLLSEERALPVEIRNNILHYLSAQQLLDVIRNGSNLLPPDNYFAIAAQSEILAKTQTHAHPAQKNMLVRAFNNTQNSALTRKVLFDRMHQHPFDFEMNLRCALLLDKQKKRSIQEVIPSEITLSLLPLLEIALPFYSQEEEKALFNSYMKDLLSPPATAMHRLFEARTALIRLNKYWRKPQRTTLFNTLIKILSDNFSAWSNRNFLQEHWRTACKIFMGFDTEPIQFPSNFEQHALKILAEFAPFWEQSQVEQLLPLILFHLNDAHGLTRKNAFEAVAPFKAYWNAQQRETILQEILTVETTYAPLVMAALPWNASQLKRILTCLKKKYPMRYLGPTMNALALQWTPDDIRFIWEANVVQHHPERPVEGEAILVGALAGYWSATQLEDFYRYFLPKLSNSVNALNALIELIPYLDPILHLPQLMNQIFPLLNNASVYVQGRAVVALSKLQARQIEKNTENFLSQMKEICHVAAPERCGAAITAIASLVKQGQLNKEQIADTLIFFIDKLKYFPEELKKIIRSESVVFFPYADDTQRKMLFSLFCFPNENIFNRLPPQRRQLALYASDEALTKLEPLAEMEAKLIRYVRDIYLEAKQEFAPWILQPSHGQLINIRD